MSDRPNILLLFTDQHRLSALGCYGPTPCRTPNLDRLAANGVRFETCYTSCPVCSPARATIMTGQHLHSHGVTSNVHNIGCNIQELPDGPHLLSRRLNDAGYRCGYTGKWHLGQGSEQFNVKWEAALPTNRGFVGQDFPGHGGGGFHYPQYHRYLAEHGYEHRVIPADRPTALPACGVLDEPIEATVPWYLAQNSIDMIDAAADRDQPFFVWHNNWGPHAPYYATADYYDMYRDVEIAPWPNYDWPAADTAGPHRFKLHAGQGELSWEQWAETIRYYYAFTTMLDDQFGRILDHLEARGLADNTVVIFSSDHGETLGSHGGLTDKGWQHFEEIQRIGLIVHDPRPGAMAAGSVRSEFASLVDIHPTILDLAGADFGPSRHQGRSLLPLVRGETVEWRDSVVVEFLGVNSMSATMLTCRHGDLKYGWSAGNVDTLHNLADDPWELNNLADDPAWRDQLQQMRARLLTFCQESDFGGACSFIARTMGTEVHGHDDIAKLQVPIRW